MTDSSLKSFGARIKRSRIACGLTQQELADKVGTSKSVISGYESGTNDPRQSMVLRLANVLEVSVNWLLSGALDEDVGKDYYTNPETARIAQRIYEDEDLKILFDAAKNVPPEDLQIVHAMLKRLKEKESGYGED